MITVYGIPDPIKLDVYEAQADDGLTIAEIVGGVPDHLAVLWDDLSECPRDLWHIVKPKPDSHIWVTRVPQDSDVLGVVAALTITVAAIAAGNVFGPALAGGVLSEATATTLVTATVAIAGNVAVSALISPQPQTPDSGEQFNRLSSITGQSNQLNPFGVIPRIYGKHRIAPIIPMTAEPFTEIVGDSVFLRWKGVLGYGPLDIGGKTVGDGNVIDEKVVLNGDPIKIGDTSISQFSDVEYRIGEDADIGDPLYSDQVLSTDLNVDFSPTEGQVDGYNRKEWTNDSFAFVTRTTDTGADEVVLDFAFPQGLFTIDADNDTNTAGVEFIIEFKKTSDSSWTRLTGNTDGVQVENGQILNNALADTEKDDTNGEWRIHFFNAERETFRGAVRWKLPDTDQYDIRVKRRRTWIEDSPDEVINTDCIWSALRTVRNRTPFKVDGVVTMDLRIKASEQLSGTIDDLTIVATSMVPTWDGAQWTAPQPTSNPAWLYADVFAGKASGEPIARSKIDGDALKTWADLTDQEGLEYNGVIDRGATVLKVAREIASTGRAGWHIEQGKISAVPDIQEQTPQLTITPRVAWGFKETFRFPDIPHALRVTFTDPDTWQKTNRVVFDDGFDANNATKYETFETKGVTSADQAWKEGRFRLAEKRLRPTEMEFKQDVRYLLYRRGDTIQLAYDVINVGSGAGRITEITATDGSGNITEFKTDETLFMESGNTYAVKIQVIDGSGDPAVFTSTITTVTGGTNTVQLDSGSSDIQVGDHFLYGISGQEVQNVKVVTIEPEGDLTARIRVVPEAPEIYDADDGTIPTWDAKVTEPVGPGQPPQPTITGVRSDDNALLPDGDGSPRLRMLVAFNLPDDRVPVGRVQMRYRKNIGQDNPSRKTATDAPTTGVIVASDVEVGKEYEIQLRAFNVNGSKVSAWSSVTTHTVSGKTNKPPSPTNLVTTPIPGAVVLAWDNPDIADFKAARVYEAGTDDVNQATFAEQVASNQTVRRLAQDLTRYYWVTAVDTSGNESDFNAIGGARGTSKPPEGLADNLRFEGGDTGWPVQEANWQIVQDASNARSGSWVASFSGDGISRNAALRNAHTFSTSEGERYIIAGFVRSENSADGACGIRISWRDGNDAEIALSDTTANAPELNWRQVRLVEAAPAGAVQGKLEFVVQSVSTGTWYADDAFIAQIAADTDIDAGGDETDSTTIVPIFNPQFKKGSEGWTPDNDLISVIENTNNALSGSASAEVDPANASASTDALRNQSLLPVSQGERIVLAGWAKSTSTANGQVGVRISWRDDTGSEINLTTKTINPPGQDWTQVRFRTEVPDNSNIYFAVAEIVALNVTQGVWHVDNIRMQLLASDGDIDVLDTRNAPLEPGADDTEKATRVAVPNPGFEQGDKKWVADNGDWEIVQDSNDAHSGDWVARINSGTNDALRSTQVTPAGPGQRFLIEGWVRQVSADGEAGVRIAWIDRFNNEVGTAVALGSASKSGWQYVSRLVEVPRDKDVEFAQPDFVCFNRSFGTWYADDIQMSVVDDPTPQLDNVAVNPDFEAGAVAWGSDFDTWEVIQDASLARRGQWVARRQNDGGVTQADALRNRKQFPIDPDERLLARFFIQSDANADGSCEARISWRDTSGNEIAQTNIGTITGPQTSWIKSRVVVVAPNLNDLTYGVLELEVQNHTTGTWYADDGWFARIPQDVDIDAVETTRGPREGGADDTAKATQAYIVNPNFEQGDRGWNRKEPRWDVVNSPSSAHSGDYVAQADASRAADINDNARLQSTRIFPIGDGERVLASAWFRSDSTADGFAGLEVVWLSGPDRANEISRSATPLASPSTSWVRRRDRLEAPSNATHAAVNVVVASHTTGFWFADELSVDPTVKDVDIDARQTTAGPTEADADKTSNNTAKDINNQGALATRDNTDTAQIIDGAVSDRVSTYGTFAPTVGTSWTDIIKTGLIKLNNTDNDLVTHYSGWWTIGNNNSGVKKQAFELRIITRDTNGNFVAEVWIDRVVEVVEDNEGNSGTITAAYRDFLNTGDELEYVVQARKTDTDMSNVKIGNNFLESRAIKR